MHKHNLAEFKEKAILHDAAKNMGWRSNDEDEPLEPYLKRLEEMEPEQIFDRFLRWHGIQGWTLRLWSVVRVLQKLEQKPCKYHGGQFPMTNMPCCRKQDS